MLNLFRKFFNMYLDSSKLYPFLIENDISYLYHANTVCTSKSFIEKRALLSRQYMEENGLELTPQNTDELDKKFGIYNETFLDGWDLAELYKKPNIYGPVTFKFKVDILLQSKTLRITKLNPYYWHKEEGWFSSEEEYTQRFPNFDKLDKGHKSFVLEAKLPFSTYLEEIIFDFPNNRISNEAFLQSVDYVLCGKEAFKKEFPNIRLTRRDKFKSYWNRFSKEDVKRFYKRSWGQAQS